MSRIALDDPASARSALPPDDLSPQTEAQGPERDIKRRRRLLVTLAVLALAGSALFLLTSFHMMQAQFSAEHQVTTVALGVDATHRLPLERRVDLYILGEPAFAGNLAEDLTARLHTNQYLGAIESRQPPLAPGKESVLVVEIQRQSVLWTPLYSKAELNICAGYASDGAVDWIDPQGASLSASPGARIHGEYVVHDSAFGLMSRPGYYDYLNEKIATEIGESLDAALAGLAR